jgi:NADPH-dependent F420 reductase
MKIAVIGTGSVGKTLGTRWALQGHDVIFGSRDPERSKVTALLTRAGERATAASIPDAVAPAEIVVLATPWGAAQEVAGLIDDWNGKVLIDCTNPIAPGFQLAVGTTTSAGEQIAARASGARVVKAFNTTGAENMADPIYHGEPITMFICGDDADAKTAVTQLAQDLGFEVVDTGDLSMARLLEPLALVWIQLAIGQGGLGRNIAFKLVKR